MSKTILDQMKDLCEKKYEYEVYQPSYMFYPTVLIKEGIKINFFDNKDGHVCFGEIKVIDTVTQEEAMWDDYI